MDQDVAGRADATLRVAEIDGIATFHAPVPLQLRADGIHLVDREHEARGQVRAGLPLEADDGFLGPADVFPRVRAG